jgi:hypothetical protein
MLEAGGIVAHSQLEVKKITPHDISHSQIQGRRARTQVPFPPGGNLHDYVPFYFARRSPMLYTISRGNLASCPEGQTKILHLVAEVEDVQSNQLAFVYTDGHAAITELSEFYDSLDKMSEVIDWPLMTSKWWNDTSNDPDRARRRQAEFLIHQFFPWSLVRGIGVQNTHIEQEVAWILKTYGINTKVKVYPDWYY